MLQQFWGQDQITKQARLEQTLNYQGWIVQPMGLAVSQGYDVVKLHLFDYVNSQTVP